MNRSKIIKQQLLLVTNLTGGQLPYGTLAKIAKMNNVSREWVRQMAEKLQLVSIRTITQNGTTYCLVCKKKIVSRNGAKKYCSPTCFKLHYRKKYYTSTHCKICKKEIIYRKSSVKIPTYYSRKCLAVIMHKGLKKFAMIRSSIYPKTKKDFLRDLGHEFTIIDFARKYKISYAGAGNLLINYRIRNLISVRMTQTKGNKNIYTVL